MTFYDNVFAAPPGLIDRGQKDRQHLMRTETEHFLRSLSEDYAARQGDYWHRDYSSEEAFLASVEPNRQRWLEAVGDFGPPVEDMAPVVEPWIENDRMKGHWVTIDLYPGLRGRGVLVIPKDVDGPVPLVICQHGIGSSPERVFGFLDDASLYHHYGQRTVEAGYAVLAPCNITEGPPRARYTRLCTMLGKTLWGLEIAKIKRLIDYAATGTAGQTARGMWGISLAWLHDVHPPWSPVFKDARTAWSTIDQEDVIDDPRYSMFSCGAGGASSSRALAAGIHRQRPGPSIARGSDVQTGKGTASPGGLLQRVRGHARPLREAGDRRSGGVRPARGRTRDPRSDRTGLPGQVAMSAVTARRLDDSGGRRLRGMPSACPADAELLA